jgi:hypothetical protein
MPGTDSVSPSRADAGPGSGGPDRGPGSGPPAKESGALGLGAHWLTVSFGRLSTMITVTVVG